MVIKTLTNFDILAVVAVAVVGFATFGFWLRNSVVPLTAKKAKRSPLPMHEVPRWVGPGYSRKHRRF